MRRSSPSSIDASMVVVYYASVVVVPKVKHRHRKANLTTFLVNVDTICAFSWMCQYEASRSVFLVRIRFEVHLRRMAAIMWNILRIQKPLVHRCRESLGTWLFTNSPDGSWKEQSWVKRLLV